MLLFCLFSGGSSLVGLALFCLLYLRLRMLLKNRCLDFGL